MEKKKMVLGASILFFVIVLINIGAGFIDFSGLPLFATILLAQGLIIVPVIIYVIVTKQNFLKLIRLQKVNPWSLLLIIPLTYLLQPLLVCINAISMSFSTNVIADTMGGIMEELPYIAFLSLMALLPAMVEEITFRGVLLNSFHRDSNPWPGILFSALCFGCMHMNINQIAYALVLGIIMGIILEATGSILSTMVVHFVFNGTSVTLAYLLPKLTNWYMDMLEESGITPEQLGMSQQELDEMMNVGQAASSVSQGQMLLTGAIMLIPALVCLILAALLLYYIAYLNKRQLILKGMFTKKTQEQKEAMAADRVRIMNVFLGFGLGFCIIYAILTEILLRLL